MPTILIVDDELYIRKFLSTFLIHKGYDVIVAEDGHQAIDRFLQESPAAIVLDLRMPGMDGLTVLKQIRTINPRQPIIVLTGGTEYETEEQVRALGVTELVEKESAVHLLDDALKRVLAADVS